MKIWFAATCSAIIAIGLVSPANAANAGLMADVLEDVPELAGGPQGNAEAARRRQARAAAAERERAPEPAPEVGNSALAPAPVPRRKPRTIKPPRYAGYGEAPRSAQPRAAERLQAAPRFGTGALEPQYRSANRGPVYEPRYRRARPRFETRPSVNRVRPYMPPLERGYEPRYEPPPPPRFRAGYQPPPPYGYWRDEAIIPPWRVMRRVRMQGFEEPHGLRCRRYRCRLFAFKYGHLYRVVVDRHSGEVIRQRALDRY